MKSGLLVFQVRSRSQNALEQKPGSVGSPPPSSGIDDASESVVEEIFEVSIFVNDIYDTVVKKDSTKVLSVSEGSIYIDKKELDEQYRSC